MRPLCASQAEYPKLTIFLASASAPGVASAIGVLAGSWLSHWVNARVMRYVAGVAIGAGILWSGD